MAQYIVIGSHTPGQCPGANGVMRSVMKQLLDAAPVIAERHGVKVAMGPVHLDPAHKIMVMLEAPSQDVVNDVLIENRLGQIQSIEIFRAVPLQDLMTRTQNQEPLY